MSKIEVSFSVSIDGFGAAPQQSVTQPIEKNGERYTAFLHKMNLTE